VKLVLYRVYTAGGNTDPLDYDVSVCVRFSSEFIPQRYIIDDIDGMIVCSSIFICLLDI
jgi:hypothetical protein